MKEAFGLVQIFCVFQKGNQAADRLGENWAPQNERADPVCSDKMEYDLVDVYISSRLIMYHGVEYQSRYLSWLVAFGARKLQSAGVKKSTCTMQTGEFCRTGQDGNIFCRYFLFIVKISIDKRDF
jgi:hypothetical protein